MKLVMPIRTGIDLSTEDFELDKNLVIVGANGSGKSRLGTWIETKMPNAYRVSAQRSLTIPEFAPLLNLEQAEGALYTGSQQPDVNSSHKWTFRWGLNPSVHLLTDYDNLLSTLFARQTKRDNVYTKEAKKRLPKNQPQESEIDIIVRIWNQIIPHRKLGFEDGKVITYVEGSGPYHGRQMSDGERVILYLIGQCLCAPANSVVIIDEPEIHIHKAILTKLWNVIEEICPDKNLVYITHDLDFASSRRNAKKIWVKSHDGTGKWEWEELPESAELPENLLIEILGSRQNTLFCEGEKNSRDINIYELAYPAFHIVPRASCDKVIESTKAMSALLDMHHRKVVGIIDRDYKAQSEIDALEKSNIFTINVAEVENLFFIEPLLGIVADHLHLNKAEKIIEVKNMIFKRLTDELEVQVTNYAQKEIQYKLNKYSKTKNSEQGLTEGFTNLINSIDISGVYNQSKQLYENAINTSNYSEALRLYNQKNLGGEISSIFGLNKNGYTDLVLRIANGDKKDVIVEALKQHLPVLD